MARFSYETVQTTATFLASVSALKDALTTLALNITKVGDTRVYLLMFSFFKEISFKLSQNISDVVLEETNDPSVQTWHRE